MILICPTAFKGTLTATEVAEAMARGARDVVGDEEVRVLPLSDGGNGLLECLHHADREEAATPNSSRLETTTVSGPLLEPVRARYLVQRDRLVVETAEACGLHLVPEQRRDPLRTSTRGVGELLMTVAAAADPRAVPPQLVVGLGGSATVDAGAGMAAALGWRLLDEGGNPIPDGGEGLLHLHAIEPPPTRPNETDQQPEAGTHIPAPLVLADVENPLLGPTGAAPVYAPQKGATPDAVRRLEEGLAKWAEVVRRDVGRDVGRDAGRDVAALPGSGAAGGLGAAFAAFLDAPPRPGADWLLGEVGFHELLTRARLVITGEGAWDGQSSMGKVTGRVVEHARRADVPVAIVTAVPPEAGDAPEAGDGPERGTGDDAGAGRELGAGGAVGSTWMAGARIVYGQGGMLGAADLRAMVAGLLRDGVPGGR